MKSQRFDVCVFRITQSITVWIAPSTFYIQKKTVAQFDQKCRWFARLQIGGNQELFVFIIPQQPHPGSSGLSRMVRFQ